MSHMPRQPRMSFGGKVWDGLWRTSLGPAAQRKATGLPRVHSMKGGWLVGFFLGFACCEVYSGRAEKLCPSRD